MDWWTRVLPAWATVAVVAGTSVGALVGVGSAIEPGAFGPAVTRALADPVAGFVAVGAFGAAFVVRGLAWSTVLPGLSRAHAIAAVHLATGANHVLPLRLGEPLRVVSAVRRARVPPAEATASTITLRAADIVTLGGLGLVVAPDALSRLVGGWGLVAIGAVAAIGMAGFGALVAQRARGARIRLPGPAVLGATTGAWLLEAVLVWQVARWFGVELSATQAVFVLAVSVTAQLAAVAPGGFGTYEAAATAALAVHGVPVEIGLAVAVGVHALKTTYTVAAGLAAVFVPAPALFGRLRLPVVADRTAQPAEAGPVVLFLPAHDEAPRIDQVIARAPAAIAGHDVEVVVVDDGSTDGTAEVARRAGARVVVHPENRGLGAAVQTGLAVATASGAVAVAFCDADGEYDPAELARLVEPVLEGRADYVVGSRFAGHIERMAPQRRLGNRILTGWIAWVTRRRISDGQSGYRALSARAAAEADLPHDYNYAQVLTVDLVSRGLGYHEVPITYSARRSGRSFVRLGSYLRAVVPNVWRLVNQPTPAITSAPEH